MSLILAPKPDRSVLPLLRGGADRRRGEKTIKKNITIYLLNQLTFKT